MPDVPADAPTTRRLPTTTPPHVRVPVQYQQASVECGAACLGMVLAAHGRWVRLDELRDACGVDRDGASLTDVAHAAQEYGLTYRAHVGDVESLDGLAVPAIAWWDRNHFVVLEGAHGGRYRIADPARGRYTIDDDEFRTSYSGIALALEAGAGFVRSGHRFRVAGSLRRRLLGSRPGVVFAVITGVLAMALGILVGPVNQVFVNDVLGAGHEELLPWLVAIMAGIALYRGGLTLLQAGVLARIQARFTLTGSVGLLDRLVRLPLAFYLARAPGDLSQRVGLNATVAQLLAGQLAMSLIALLAVGGYAVILLYYSWTIGLAVLVIASINAVVLRSVLGRRGDLQNRILIQGNRLSGVATSAVRDIESVKATGREAEVFADLTGRHAGYVSATAALAPSSALLAAVPPALAGLTSAVVLVVGGYLTIQGNFTIGALLAVQALALGLNAPIQTLMATASEVQVIIASMASLDDVLAGDEDARVTRPVLAPGEPFVPLRGHLRLEDVSFSYSAKAGLVVRGLDLDVRPGQRVALVGTSGAGKSTIGNLAVGLLTPTSGRVRYDGHELADLPVPTLEDCVAKVDQAVVLFAGTVRDNVTLWDRSIPDEDVLRALADAQVLGDVLDRPGGLDAVIEEDGRNVSGGQAQRIEIARALARGPRLLVLDEATSALDDVTEAEVDAAIRRRGIATLVIAHRLSAIRDADEIVVLGAGGVVLERGTHDELLDRDGTYARLVDEAGDGGDVGV